MPHFRETTEESRLRWEANADYWDERMGNESNEFHREIVRPATDKLLQVGNGDRILEIACGTGNYSEWCARMGADVTAYDYSRKMIDHARRRRTNWLHQIRFRVCDATSRDNLEILKQDGPFDKAVSNMALMDISDLEQLFASVHDFLVPGGIFVFSTHHPCFTGPDGRYLTSCIHEGKALARQPEFQYYYHRSLQDLFGICFKSGFVIDAFHEIPDDDPESPIIMVIPLRKGQDRILPDIG